MNDKTIAFRQDMKHDPVNHPRHYAARAAADAAHAAYLAARAAAAADVAAIAAADAAQARMIAELGNPFKKEA